MTAFFDAPLRGPHRADSSFVINHRACALLKAAFPPIFLDLKIAAEYIPSMLARFLRSEVRRRLLQNPRIRSAAGAAAMSDKTRPA